MIGLDPISTAPKGGDHPEAKHDSAEFVWRPKSLGPSKDFATKINPKIMAKFGDPISYMKQCRISRHGILLAKIIIFSGNPQKPSKGVPSWFPIVLTYNGEVMNIEKKNSLKIYFK